MRVYTILLFTLISLSSHAGPKEAKVVLEDMGNVGYRISDAQALINWVASGLRPRVGRTQMIYEGLLNSKKDLQRRLGTTENQSAQMEEIERLEAFTAQANVWFKAKFGKDKKGHWVEMTCRNKKSKGKKTIEKERIYAKKFKALEPLVAQSLKTFCSKLIPLAQVEIETGPKLPQQPSEGTAPLRKPKPKWLPPQRR
jgi:hypothetical protein